MEAVERLRAQGFGDVLEKVMHRLQAEVIDRADLVEEDAQILLLMGAAWIVEMARADGLIREYTRMRAALLKSAVEAGSDIPDKRARAAFMKALGDRPRLDQWRVEDLS